MLATIVASLFKKPEFTEEKREKLDQLFRETAYRTGFKYTGDSEDGMKRSFHRAMDGKTVDIPTKENLTARDEIWLHEFECYL